MSKPVDVITPSPAQVGATAPTTNRRIHLRVGERRAILVMGDVVASLVAAFAALWVWAFVAGYAFTTDFVLRQVHWFIILPLLWLVLASVNDYYNLRITARTQSSFWRLVRVMLQLLVIYVAIFFFSPRTALPRLFIVYYGVISLVLISAWRSVRVLLIRWSGFRRRALIVGAGQGVESIWQIVNEEAHGDYEIVGCIASSASWAPSVPGLKVLGTGVDLLNAVHANGISEIIIAYGDDVPADLFQAVMSCYTQGVVVVPMATLFEQITGRVPIEHMNEQLWALVLPLEGYTLSFHIYLLFKRTIDILFALCGLLLVLPIFPLLALLIKLDSRGPVFYQQERVGQGGRTFGVIKFRSMVTDAEQGTGPQWAKRNDPRITRIGRFLRKTRLDEVPQLLNVLRGDMSVVGPRPERGAFVDMLTSEIPFYRSRLAIKPGLTGWAQVRYRYGSTTDDQLRKLQYDLYYIRHQSILLDLLIMAQTVGTVLAMKGQ